VPAARAKDSRLDDTAARRAARAHARRLRGAAQFGGGDGLRRAQGGGVPPAADRAVPGRPEGPAAAAGGRRQADVQGGAAAARGRRAALRAGADHLGDGRVRRVRRRAVRRRDDPARAAEGTAAAAGGRRQRRGPGDLRDRLDGRLRDRARRLELEQQVLAARRAALVGADDQLRAVLRHGARRGAADRQLAVAHRHRPAAGRRLVRRDPAVVHLPAADRVPGVPDRRHRRDQPRAVRLPGSGAGAGRRLSHRIQQHELRDVLPRGVHQHGDGVGGRDRSVPRRLARAVSARVARLDLVRSEGRGDSLFLRLDALDAAALPLRPADALRLESAAAARGGQPARDGGRRAVFRGLMISFYVFGAIAVVASLLVIAQRNPIYSVLLLIASFGALSGLYVLLDAPFVAVIQIIVYAG